MVNKLDAMLDKIDAALESHEAARSRAVRLVGTFAVAEAKQMLQSRQKGAENRVR